MNSIQKKILYSLDEDTSKTLTAISNEIGESVQLVRYHLEELEKETVIQEYFPMVDFRRLGYTNISYFLKLKGVTREVRKELSTFFNEHHEITIVMWGDGYFDVHITISTQSIFNSDRVFSQLLGRFSKNILDYGTALSAGFYQFRRHYFISEGGEKNALEPLSVTGGDVSEVTLSEFDRTVLEAINNNSRQHDSEIARTLKSTRDRVSRSIQRLQASGVLQKSSYILNHDKMGYELYRILVGVQGLTDDRFKKILEYCNKHKNVIHVLKLVGNWQLLIDIEIEDRESLRNLLFEMTAAFKDSIRRADITRVYEIQKFRDVPRSLCE